nr:DNA-directed RNA polymerase III subunit RPC7-like [Ipomoea batatas]
MRMEVEWFLFYSSYEVDVYSRIGSNADRCAGLTVRVDYRLDLFLRSTASKGPPRTICISAHVASLNDKQTVNRPNLPFQSLNLTSTIQNFSKTTTQQQFFHLRFSLFSTAFWEGQRTLPAPDSRLRTSRILREFQMAFRGRGRGRGGFGGGFRIAKQEPFELFPKINDQDLGNASNVTERLSLAVWYTKLQKYWNSSPYFLGDESDNSKKTKVWI